MTACDQVCDDLQRLLSERSKVISGSRRDGWANHRYRRTICRIRVRFLATYPTARSTGLEVVDGDVGGHIVGVVEFGHIEFTLVVLTRDFEGRRHTVQYRKSADKQEDHSNNERRSKRCEILRKELFLVFSRSVRYIPVTVRLYETRPNERTGIGDCPPTPIDPRNRFPCCPLFDRSIVPVHSSLRSTPARIAEDPVLPVSSSGGGTNHREERIS
jgi:hypothetical protein